MSGEIRFVQGNEACVRGALYAGVRFFAGYPITPSTEIAEHLSEELPRVGGRFVQMEDEIASMCAVCGASLAGSKAMTATSGPGFSLKQEALGYAIMAEIPCVIVDVQRGGPSTGLPTECSQGDVMQARWGAHGDHAIIALTASSIQDVFSMTVEAFNLAETYRTPVVLLFDEVIGHMREKLEIPAPGVLPVVERLHTDVPEGVNYHPYLPREDGRLPMSDFGGVHRYNVTGLHHDIWGFPTQNATQIVKLNYHLYDKIENRAHILARWKEYFLEDAEQILVSYGSQCPPSGGRPPRQGRPHRPARTADTLALPGPAGTGKNGPCQERLRRGNEYGPDMRPGEERRGQSRSRVPCQPYGRQAGNAHGYRPDHARH